jgi:hypothetical protein
MQLTQPYCCKNIALNVYRLQKTKANLHLHLACVDYKEPNPLERDPAVAHTTRAPAPYLPKGVYKFVNNVCIQNTMCAHFSYNVLFVHT